MSQVLALQRQRNIQTSDAWNSFAGHRRRVMQLIERCTTERQGNRSPVSLAVLGAGNCNDLDLKQIAATLARVVLIDCDRQAVEQGLARQFDTPPGSMQIYAPCDVSGLARVVDNWPTPLGAPNTLAPKPAQPGHASPLQGLPDQSLPNQSLTEPAFLDQALPEQALQQLAQQPLIDWSPTLVGTVDVAVSTCLLTQLIDAVRMWLGGEHPQFLEVVQAVRQRHLLELATLLKPGGYGIFISDFVSSDTWPELVTLEDQRLPKAVAEQLRRSNFFTGVNPLVIRQQLIQEPALSALVTKVTLTQPWKWCLGTRVYAVYAICFQRTAETSSSTGAERS